MKNGEKKILERTRLKPQGMASKRRSTKLAMKTEIIRKNKMEANMMKQKIWYLVWIMFIKIY